MNFVFSPHNLLNADVLESSTTEPILRISTPRRGNTTEVRDMRTGQVVAKYHLEHDRMTYAGKTMRVSEWLPKKSFLSRQAVKLSSQDLLSVR
ncbi:hypothetical protein C8Q74DRAFT_1279567 [Fomes fomentarius]|nr:hypothetical protein C8Q74DRAFT_1279567 [Fomes fomentarius]